MTRTENRFLIGIFTTSLFGAMSTAFPYMTGMFVASIITTACLGARQVAIDIVEYRLRRMKETE